MHSSKERSDLAGIERQDIVGRNSFIFVTHPSKILSDTEPTLSEPCPLNKFVFTV